MMTRFTLMWALTFLGVAGLAALVQDDPLRTRAERTNFEETSRLEDVTAFLTARSAKAPLVRLQNFGATEQGRQMPLVILSNPAVNRQPIDRPDARSFSCSPTSTAVRSKARKPFRY